MEEKEEQEIVEKLWGTPSASADLQALEKSELQKKDKSNLYLYDRNDNNKYNKVLIKINEKFSSVEKVSGIFELFFKDDGQLNIVECGDFYFMQSLSIEDLKQLAQYFLLVAHFMEGQNKIVNEKDEIIEEDKKREMLKNCGIHHLLQPNFLGRCIFDNLKNELITVNIPIIISILNQQDAKIKELEEENKRLFSLTQLNDCVFCEKMSIKYNQMLVEENQQLKEQYDLLNKKYCEEMDKNIALAEQLKQSQK